MQLKLHVHLSTKEETIGATGSVAPAHDSRIRFLAPIEIVPTLWDIFEGSRLICTHSDFLASATGGFADEA